MGDRRTQLVEAAISRAVREGLADTTVRGIAEEAGVSLSTVHYCFASKSELLRAVARAIAGPLSAPVTTAITGMSGDGDPAGAAGVEDVLRAAFRRLLGRGPQHPRTPAAQLRAHHVVAAQPRPGPRSPATCTTASTPPSRGSSTRSRDTCGVTWSVPVPVLARMVVATTTGVRLAWLVDHDDDAARATLDTFAGVVAELRRPGGRLRPTPGAAR